MHPDDHSYLKYTTRQQLDKAMHSLEGIVRGIAIDNLVNNRELVALTTWIGDHLQYANRHPFNDVISRLQAILADGVVDEEEIADVVWLCNKFTTEDTYFSKVTSDMQRLQGILGGIVADDKVTELELRGLREWMSDNEHLKTCWPYDELEALLLSILADGHLDEKEEEALKQFFNEFFVHTGHRAIELRSSEDIETISGVCAVCPEIRFPGHAFCFTGKSKRTTRAEIEEKILSLGGSFSPRVTQTIDYLIIGADGNPCWSYACYGRKVEAAVGLRKKGASLLIVHEYDFWDAYEDHA
ncbi:MAG: hypothetical protein JNK57_02855 [Planctomycetaceae bacterium]|nr:hypothetical protein [Planctomycetaceae bacterium]